ncbi:MAG: glycosyl transferase, group 1 [Candidatus Adlerbacteria bacterium]|nr:glycosyl transferase, group 1 [Candidatus Adlerbacteria bacterium]
MRIGFDAVAAIGRSGNATYSYELISHVMRRGAANRYYLFSYLHDMGRPLFKKGAGHTEVHSQLVASLFPLPHLHQVNDFLLRLHARARRVDIFHFTNPLNYIDGPFKKVVTVHDLAPLHDPSWTKEHSGRLFKERLGAVARADAIIAVSKFTKQDIVEKLGVAPERITVVYEGAGNIFYPDEDKAGIAALVGDSRYVLCVGQLQPRKNNRNLLLAFASIAPDFPDTKLVFAGSAVSPEYLQGLKDAAAASGVEGSIVFAGSVGNDFLRRLYTHAFCFAYPSFFEGFGLPILESLQCGVPVITSDASSLPEVAGDAGLLVNPHSVESIAAALRQLLCDTAVKDRLLLAIPAQLAKFSWKKAAEETLKVYESLS